MRRRTLSLTIITGATLVFAATIFALTSTADQVRRPSTDGTSARASLVPEDIAPQARHGKSTQVGERGEPRVNWDRPFIDGVSVSSVAAAADQLPFRPALPATVGTPAVVVVHGDIGGHSGFQALGLAFSTPAAGRFIVTEEPTKSSTPELQQLAASCDPTSGCEGSWTMVTLSDGMPALEIAADVSTGLVWIKNAVRYDVYGPSSTFSSARATQLANAFEAATK